MSVKDINIKNLTYYFFDDIINLKELDPNHIKTDKKSQKRPKIYSVNPLYHIFSNVNG